MSGRIFLSYRREDEPGFALALYGRLEQAFPPERLFMDVEGGIAAGLDFVRVLEEQVRGCDVMLALIGRNWLKATDDIGRRRLDNPNDFVRIEIESALRHGKWVIPVLVHKTEMPGADALPEPLKPLAQRNAVRLTQDRFKADAQALIKALEVALAEVEARRRADEERMELARRAKERERSPTAQELQQVKQYLIELESALEQYRFGEVRTLTDRIDPAAFDLPQIKKALYLIRRKRLFNELQHAASLFNMSALPPKADIRSPSRHLSRSQTCKGPFPLFGRLCHTLKKDGRALYRHSFTGTVNFPSPGLSQTSSSLHGERIVGWIKFSTRHALERKRGNA